METFGSRLPGSAVVAELLLANSCGSRDTMKGTPRRGYLRSLMLNRRVQLRSPQSRIVWDRNEAPLRVVINWLLNNSFPHDLLSARCQDVSCFLYPGGVSSLKITFQDRRNAKLKIFGGSLSKGGEVAKASFRGGA